MRGNLSPEMAVFVGLDCGGSSTRVLAIDEHGKAVFRGQSGPANLLSTPDSQMRLNLRTACHKCPKATSVFACFAGLINDEVKAKALAMLKPIFPGTKILDAQADYVAALAACGKDATACVIAGTGSIVCSWQDGRVIKSGGRGPMLGDVGSASNVGRGLLNAYLDEPSSASSALKRAVTEIFGSSEERAILRRLYDDGSPAALLGQLGKVAAKASLAGSEAAQDIIHREMAGLCRLAVRHLRKFHSSQPTARIGLAGGLWKSSPLYKTEFENCLVQELPEMKVDLFVLKRAPVEGAAMLAKEAASGN